MSSIFRWAVHAQHWPGWRAPVARAVLTAYTQGVLLAARLRGVKARRAAPGMVTILGPRYGRGSAVWADYVGLLARDARQRAIAADQAVEFWARREGRA